ncbi:MAG: hypothetical protein Q8908_13940 [Bacteroidota bacterium]|nr:hypothetical protein [Bacteroidota bacterium]
MKRLFQLMVVAGMASFVMACGPSASEKAKIAEQDSIRRADSIATLKADSIRKADSLAAINSEATRKADSTKKADSIAAAKKGKKK